MPKLAVVSIIYKVHCRSFDQLGGERRKREKCVVKTGVKWWSALEISSRQVAKEELRLFLARIIGFRLSVIKFIVFSVPVSRSAACTVHCGVRGRDFGFRSSESNRSWFVNELSLMPGTLHSQLSNTEFGALLTFTHYTQQDRFNAKRTSLGDRDILSFLRIMLIIAPFFTTPGYYKKNPLTTANIIIILLRWTIPTLAKLNSTSRHHHRRRKRYAWCK